MVNKLLSLKDPDPAVALNQQKVEAEEAVYQLGFFRAANEVKPFADLKSVKGPILRIIEKEKTPTKKSARNRPRRETSAFLLEQMNSCNQVLGFNQHSLFDMKILLSIIRFCVDSINFDKGDVSVVEATNRVDDSFTVGSSFT